MSRDEVRRARRLLTDKEKEKFLGEHLFYEVQMLHIAVNKIVEYKRKKKPDKYPNNMAVGTCLLHARNLYEFFFKSRSKGYIRALDILDNWKQPQPEQNSWIARVKCRVNDEITHLTFGRMSSRFSGTDWNCCAIRKEFFDVIHRFLRQLPKKYMDERLGKLEDRISSVLGSYVPEDKNGVTSTSSNIDIIHHWEAPK